MSSSWAAAGPKSKIVDTHYHVGYFCGLISAILGLGVVFSLHKGVAFEDVAVLAVAIVLTIAHFRSSDAAEKEANWAPAATVVLSLPLLFAFPTGTYLGAKLLMNTSKLK